MKLKLKKSAGIAVTAAVHQHISKGNSARDAKDWTVAASAYAAALCEAPELYHIWIQLGHTYREGGNFEQAQEAYGRAAALREELGEPYLHLGHLMKVQGDAAQARSMYLSALRRIGVEAEAEHEVVGQLGHIVAPYVKLLAAKTRTPRDHDQPTVAAKSDTTANVSSAVDELTERLDALAATGHQKAIAAQSELERLKQEWKAPTVESTEDLSRPSWLTDAPVINAPVVFDITDLVAHFRNHRLPTGIQRVQIEVIAGALTTSAAHLVTICSFIDGRDTWIQIPNDRFSRTANAARAGHSPHDIAWEELKSELFFYLYTDAHYELPDNAVLVNLGTSWWIYDYFRLLRNAREEKNVRYIPFVHDLIPVMAPQYCVRGVSEDYISWVIGAYYQADLFLANSESTANDLIRVARRLGHDLNLDSIDIIPLDADFRRSDAPEQPASSLAQWDLQDVPYALFVSTIEARKNHGLAFDSWIELLNDHHVDEIPQLVCVGRDGWLNDSAYHRLQRHPMLRRKVTIIHQVSDAELALLYRNCDFTLYPSHYEGWGLPITESLCYGKLPIIADNSSLPEAGAGFALIFESNSLRSCVSALEKAIYDVDWRRSEERRIRKDFKARSWSEIAASIWTSIAKVAAAEIGKQPSTLGRITVASGKYYPTQLYKGVRIWESLASGEIFRHGNGWLWPEPNGCRTKPQGGILHLWPETKTAEFRLYILIRGLDSKATRVSIAANGAQTSVQLAAGSIRWCFLTVEMNEEGCIPVFLKGDQSELIEMSTGGTCKHFNASIGVVGFALIDSGDIDARARFTFEASFGSTDNISAFGRPPLPA